MNVQPIKNMWQHWAEMGAFSERFWRELSKQDAPPFSPLSFSYTCNYTTLRVFCSLSSSCSLPLFRISCRVAVSCVIRSHLHSQSFCADPVLCRMVFQKRRQKKRSCMFYEMTASRSLTWNLSWQNRRANHVGDFSPTLWGRELAGRIKKDTV